MATRRKGKAGDTVDTGNPGHFGPGRGATDIPRESPVPPHASPGEGGVGRRGDFDGLKPELDKPEIARRALTALPRHIDLPMPGGRLDAIVDLSHGPQVVQVIQENYDFLGPWFPWAKNRDVELPGFQAWFESRQLKDDSPADYSIVLDDRVVGRLSAWSRPEGTVEFGYWLAESATGKGLVSAGLRHVEQLLAEAGVSRFEIHFQPENSASAAVAARCGYAVVGSYSDRPSDPGVEFVVAAKQFG